MPRKVSRFNTVTVSVQDEWVIPLFGGLRSFNTVTVSVQVKIHQQGRDNPN